MAIVLSNVRSLLYFQQGIWQALQPPMSGWRQQFPPSMPRPITIDSLPSDEDLMNSPRVKSRFVQSGSYVIWVLILLPVLVWAMALAFDVGIAQADRQRAHTAADAAALAGAFTVKEERSNLASADPNVVAAAKARVATAARLGAKANGFEQGMKGVIIDVEYPPAASYFAPYQNLGDYLGIRIRRPTPSSFANFFGTIPSIPVEVTAVGRAGTDTAGNTCPGLYLYGHTHSKTTDLKHGSKYFIHGGGIYLDASGTAMYGSSGSEMEAQWIEAKDVNPTNSVEYFCDAYPRANSSDHIGDQRCVQPLSTVREAPENFAPGPCTQQNTNCNVGLDSSTALAQLKCGCTEKKGVVTCSYTRNLNASSSVSPVLEAGTFCGGLTIEDTGTTTLPLVLQASTSSDTFIFANSTGTSANGNLIIQGSSSKPSYFTALSANGYAGVTLYSPGGQMGMTYSQTSNPNTPLRIYFDAMALDYSTLDISPYQEQQCGLLPAITTVVVQ